MSYFDKMFLNFIKLKTILSAHVIQLEIQTLQLQRLRQDARSLALLRYGSFCEAVRRLKRNNGVHAVFMLVKFIAEIIRSNLV